MSEQITREQFAATNGQTYQLKADTLVDVKLLKVTECKDCGGGFESFSLLFEGDEGDLLPQSNYDIENETLGSTKIFISPIHFAQAQDGKAYYQAVFSAKKT